jgi:enoyl-[acyl-carrier-protein] reductase (NADH)
MHGCTQKISRGSTVFLASDHAAGITGQAINANHGEFLA